MLLFRSAHLKQTLNIMKAKTKNWKQIIVLVGCILGGIVTGAPPKLLKQLRMSANRYMQRTSATGKK